VHGPIRRTSFRTRFIRSNGLESPFYVVQIQPRFLAGEAEDEDVVLQVGVEIVDVGEEVVRVAIDVENLRLVVGVLFLKRRPFPPERAGDYVGFAIAIDVADGGTFGVKIAMADKIYASSAMKVPVWSAG
jgi:hypothetical protein